MRCQLSTTGGGGWIPLGLSSCNCIPDGNLRGSGFKAEEGVRRAVVDVERREGEGASQEACLGGTCNDRPVVSIARDERDLVVMRGVSLWIVVGDCLCRRGDELDLMIGWVVSLRRVDVLLSGHRRRMILNLEWTFSQ